MNKIFDINFQQLFVNLLPTFLRKKRLVVFLGIVATQLQAVHHRFVSYRADFTSGTVTQLCVLRKLLNDWFDPYERGIRLRNVKPNYDALLLWQVAENKPIRLSDAEPFLLKNEPSLLLSQIDFEVLLPKGYTMTTQQLSLMRMLIDENKLPSKKYTVRNE